MADPKFVKRGETIYQLRPHLSQMHTTKYVPFTRKKSAAFWPKYEPMGRGRPPPPPPPLESANAIALQIYTTSNKPIDVSLYFSGYINRNTEHIVSIVHIPDQVKFNSNV